MKVKFKECISSVAGSYDAKTEHELDDKLAKQWIKSGYCSEVKESATKRIVKKGK